MNLDMPASDIPILCVLFAKRVPVNALDLLSIVTLQGYRDGLKADLEPKDFDKLMVNWVGVLKNVSGLMKPGTSKLDVIRAAASSAMRKGDDAKLMAILSAGATWLEEPPCKGCGSGHCDCTEEDLDNG